MSLNVVDVHLYIKFGSSVADPPQVVLHLGSTLNPDDIKEGDDVYFECNIRANPKQHKITWFHNVSIQVSLVNHIETRFNQKS